MKIYKELNNEELVDEIRRIAEEVIIPLAETKGHDYTGQDLEIDALANVGECIGWAGAFFRGRDKDQRLMTHLTKRTLKVKDESVENCFVDRLLYSFIAYILWLRRTHDVFIDLPPAKEPTLIHQAPEGVDEIIAWMCPHCGYCHTNLAHSCERCGWCKCGSSEYQEAIFAADQRAKRENET